MKGWQTTGDGALHYVDLPVPSTAEGEVLVRVEACGVCRTDLHVLHGELPPHRPRVVPGHEVVGTVVAVGGDVGGVALGDRVGVPWLRSTCGTCRWCRTGRENLCERSGYTGWDVDGGYAEYAVASAAYTYPVPAALDAAQAAPLLCAGIIGYRALKRARLPAGGRLGLYGFGASAHLTAQLALAQGAEVHVVTRDASARRLALELGASSALPIGSSPPPLDAAIVFAPAGEVARDAMADLDAAGTLALAGIYMTEIPPLDYDRHLFRERTVTSVTSNTRADGVELMRLAARLGVAATVTTYPLDRAEDAVRDLAADRVHGVAVLDLRG
ncbi:zinc-binding alcohol dehydrogenase family protein [Nocardioides sp. GY 10113]|nr:zinc-binding alcohol dehydrogenase family protein [Nocardioides sp. GY 10113]